MGHRPPRRRGLEAGGSPKRRFRPPPRTSFRGARSSRRTTSALGRLPAFLGVGSGGRREESWVTGSRRVRRGIGERWRRSGGGIPRRPPTSVGLELCAALDGRRLLGAHGLLRQVGNPGVLLLAGHGILGGKIVNGTDGLLQPQAAGLLCRHRATPGPDRQVIARAGVGASARGGGTAARPGIKTVTVRLSGCWSHFGAAPTSPSIMPGAARPRPWAAIRGERSAGWALQLPIERGAGQAEGPGRPPLVPAEALEDQPDVTQLGGPQRQIGVSYRACQADG
jgi:hypothetical protein